MGGTSPQRPVDVRGVKAAAWVLRAAVAAQAVGAALPLILNWEPSTLNSWLVMYRGWGEAAAATVDTLAGYGLMLVAVAALVFPVGPVVMLAGVWAGLLAVSAVAADEGRFPLLAPYAGAARALAPIALALLLLWPRRYAVARWRTAGAMLILRLAVAATFIGHGVEAFRLHPTFTDYILVAGQAFFSADMQQATAEWLLRLIGVADIAVAIALLGTCTCLKTTDWWKRWGWRLLVGAIAGAAVYQLEAHREPATFVAYLAEEGSYWFGVEMTAGFIVTTLAVAAGLCVAWATPHWQVITLYMAAWGLITAFARVVYDGTAGVDQALSRFAHCGAPLALFCYWTLTAGRGDSPAPPAAKDKPVTSPAAAQRPVTPLEADADGLRPLTRPI